MNKIIPSIRGRRRLFYFGRWWILIVTCLCMLAMFGAISSAKELNDDERAAKKFEPHPGKSVVYIYRNTIVAAIQVFRLYADNGIIGGSTNKSFIRIVMEPGNHTIKVTDLRNNVLDSMSISTNPGNIYYIELKIGAGIFSGKPKLVPSNEKEAKMEILKCNLFK